MESIQIQKCYIGRHGREGETGEKVGSDGMLWKGTEREEGINNKGRGEQQILLLDVPLTALISVE